MPETNPPYRGSGFAEEASILCRLYVGLLVVEEPLLDGGTGPLVTVVGQGLKTSEALVTASAPEGRRKQIFLAGWS